MVTECTNANQHFFVDAVHSQVFKFSRYCDEKWNKHDILNLFSLPQWATKIRDSLYNKRHGLRIKVPDDYSFQKPD